MSPSSVGRQRDVGGLWLCQRASGPGGRSGASPGSGRSRVLFPARSGSMRERAAMQTLGLAAPGVISWGRWANVSLLVGMGLQGLLASGHGSDLPLLTGPARALADQALWVLPCWWVGAWPVPGGESWTRALLSRLLRAVGGSVLGAELQNPPHRRAQLTLVQILQWCQGCPSLRCWHSKGSALCHASHWGVPEHHGDARQGPPHQQSHQAPLTPLWWCPAPQP